MTVRRVRSWRSGLPLSPQTQIARYVAMPLIWNAAIAYVLLVTLPKAFEVDISTMILLQPDVSWVAVASGVFAMVWGLLRTGIVIAVMSKGRFRLSWKLPNF